VEKTILYGMLLALLPLPCVAAETVEPYYEQETNFADTLTGDWGGARTRLHDAGVDVFATYSTEVWNNARGGLRQGMTWDGLLEAGFSLDLDTLVQWPGATLQVIGLWYQTDNSGSFDEDYIGTALAPSGLFANDAVRAFEIYLEQSLWEETVLIKAGQMGADSDFNLSDYTGLFLNATFGTMPTSFFNPLSGTVTGGADVLSTPQYSVASPGLLVRYAPYDGAYIQGAVYVGNTGADTAANHGFDWQTGGGSGWLLFGEIGHDYTLAGLKGTAKLGGTYHTGRFDNAVSGGTDRGLYSFYLIIDQTLLADEAGDPVLAAFWRGGLAPRLALAEFSSYTDAGLNWFGPLPGRPDDVAGVALAYAGYSRDFTAANPGTQAATTLIEVTYRAQITPWFALQPDMQVIFNPEINPNSGVRETALIFGVRGEITF
jgi:porin